MNAPRQPSYTEQIAQWRQDRMRQQVQQRVEEIKYEYQDAQRERDTAIADNDMETAEITDQRCQDLENEYAQYHPPQPPQQHPSLVQWGKANKDYVDALIAKLGPQGATNYLNMIDAKLCAPRNNYEPVKGGMGITRYSKDYFDRGKDLLELYSESATGVRYEPDATLTADAAVKMSGIDANTYNRSAQVLNQQGRYSWQNRK